MIAFYNPVKFKRILNNVLYLLQCLKDAKIPTFVVECVFHGAKPQIPDATLVLHSNSYMFYKEQLLAKLEPKIPKRYTKLVALDGDILFDAPDWIDQISESLDTYTIIQPFISACWLTPDNTRIRTKKYSFAYASVTQQPLNQSTIYFYHPGFAWAFRRDTWRALQGLYPYAVIGSGDMLFAMNFLPSDDPPTWLDATKKTAITIEHWKTYHDRFKAAAPKLGFLNMKALHLFHGLAVNRQYRTRYTDIADLIQKPWDEMITTNADGLYEWKDPAALNPPILAYFKRRDEDVPLRKAMAITRRGHDRHGQAPAHGHVSLDNADAPTQLTGHSFV